MHAVQVRECATALMQVGKRERIPIFLVGHVTKQASGAALGGRIGFACKRGSNFLWLPVSSCSLPTTAPPSLLGGLAGPRHVPPASQELIQGPFVLACLQGDLAGPRVLEHLVDTVVQMEGGRQSPVRIVSAPAACALCTLCMGDMLCIDVLGARRRWVAKLSCRLWGLSPPPTPTD